MKLNNPFDLTDLLLLCGIGLIWGALYSQVKWISFLVLGLILFGLGLIIMKNKMGGE